MTTIQNNLPFRIKNKIFRKGIFCLIPWMKIIKHLIQIDNLNGLNLFTFFLLKACVCQKKAVP